MLIQCSKACNTELLQYIGHDYPKCLYLYLNLRKYGFDNENINIYVHYEKNEINAVYLIYYSCLHIYSRDNAFKIGDILQLIKANGITMIYCMASTARIIYDEIQKVINNKVSITNGWVAQIKKIDKEVFDFATYAKNEDFSQIVQMIYSDADIGRSYKYEELVTQLRNRAKDGYARNLVVREGSNVVAHACTNAEYDSIAVVAELIVKEEFRGKGYGINIWRQICGQLLAEGKEVYSFYYSDVSRKLHIKIGFKEVCEWSKIVF